MTKTVRLDHPTFGSLTGVVTFEGPIQFRNVPYSKPPSRWQHSTVLDRLPNGPGEAYDATRWGPMSPQNEDSISFDFGLIQKELTHHRQLTCSEEKCLNLVVTTPSLDTKNLPVMVFGGFFVGCNAWPQYDLCRFVSYSQKIGKPVVGVSINYRVGILGFLASSAVDNVEQAGNYGLSDQVSALKWVQKHVAGFGGDPANVTVFGESAGSISIYLHLLRGEPLFQRAICMSGDPRLRNPQSVETNEREFFAPLVKSLGLSEMPLLEQVKVLRSLPWKTFVESEYNMRLFPSVSNGFRSLELEPDLHQRQASEHFSWCKSFMVGDCAQDASAFFRAPPKKDWLNVFKAVAQEFLSQEDVDLLVDSYNLDNGAKTNGYIDVGLIQFTSDTRFYLPVVLMASAAPKGADLRVYHIVEANPFDGPLKGFATHVLDVALIFQNYEEHLSSETSALSKQMARYFIEFASGIAEAKRDADAQTSKKVTVFGPLGQMRHMSEDDYDSTERREAARLLRGLGVDKCNRVLELFQFGRR